MNAYSSARGDYIVIAYHSVFWDTILCHGQAG